MLNKRTTEVYALGQHISMSAHKARRVIDQIRGRSYEEMVPTKCLRKWDFDRLTWLLKKDNT